MFYHWLLTHMSCPSLIHTHTNPVCVWRCAVPSRCHPPCYLLQAGVCFSSLALVSLLAHFLTLSLLYTSSGPHRLQYLSTKAAIFFSWKLNLSLLVDLLRHVRVTAPQLHQRARCCSAVLYLLQKRKLCKYLQHNDVNVKNWNRSPDKVVMGK